MLCYNGKELPYKVNRFLVRYARLRQERHKLITDWLPGAHHIDMPDKIQIVRQREELCLVLFLEVQELTVASHRLADEPGLPVVWLCHLQVCNMRLKDNSCRPQG